MLSDKDIITDCVVSQKWIESSYNYAASECSDVNIRQDMMNILNDEHENQMIFWNTMNRKGWYRPYMVNPNDLRSTQTQFSNIQNQIMSGGWQAPQYAGQQYGVQGGYGAVAQYGGQQTGTYGQGTQFTGTSQTGVDTTSVARQMRSNIGQSLNQRADINAEFGNMGGSMAGYWAEAEGASNKSYGNPGTAQAGSATQASNAGQSGATNQIGVDTTSVARQMRSNIGQSLNQRADINAEFGNMGGSMAGYWAEAEGATNKSYGNIGSAPTSAGQSGTIGGATNRAQSSYQNAIKSGQALGAGQAGYTTAGKGSSYSMFAGQNAAQAGTTGQAGFTTNVERQMQNNIQNIVRNSL